MPDIEHMLTPAERLYIDITEQDIQDVKAMPGNLDELWPIVFERVKLTAKMKRVLKEYYWDNLSPAEIAERNKTSRSSIYARLFAARQALKPEIENTIKYAEDLIVVDQIRAQWHEEASRLAVEAVNDLKNRFEIMTKTATHEELLQLRSEVNNRIAEIEAGTNLHNAGILSQSLLDIMQKLGIVTMQDVRQKLPVLRFTVDHDNPGLRHELELFVIKHELKTGEMPNKTYPHKDTGIESLNLSSRAYNCLRRANMHTTSDLRDTTIEELFDIQGAGEIIIKEIVEKARQAGIEIKPE